MTSPQSRRAPLSGNSWALAAAVLVLAAPAWAGGAAERFAEVKDSPPQLRAFLQAMPKGADLHNHLSGAVYAERFLKTARADGLCVDLNALELVAPPCAAQDGRPAAGAVLDDTAMYNRLVDSLSMRDFVATSGWSGHDQFFATFGRFTAADAALGVGEQAAPVVDRAGRQQVQHIELMTSFGAGAAIALGRTVGASADLATLEDRLMAAGMGDIVADARAELDAAEHHRRALLGCDGPTPAPGCDVSVRYIQQVLRTLPPEQVFAQTLMAFLLADADPRVAGINFVGPEDDPVAVRDYDRHMAMIDFLHGQMPKVNIALHAGELTLGLVPPEVLRDHVRQAITTGHARRIGHGVDVMYEDRPWDLLRLMADRRVAVEINLTSNAEILKVAGRDHPFETYRQAGVPVVLSTDDEGVSRIDLTHEIQRAVQTYDLAYDDLVTLARNSLEYSFLDGPSLWADTRNWTPVDACADSTPTADPAPACADWLAASDKAGRQWRLEAALAAFDREAPDLRP